MLKTYRSETLFVLNIYTKDLGNRHITFDEVSNGGSIFVTNNEAIQKALEKSKFFNNGFYLDRQTDDVVTPAEVKQEEESKVRVVNVSSVTEARDYLVDYYDMTRSSLRSKVAIVAAGEAHGIQFEGLE